MSIRKVIRQLIMEEVKDSNFIPSAENGKINLEGKKWGIKISGVPIPVLKIETKGGNYKITIKTPYIPFISEGSERQIEIKKPEVMEAIKKGLISDQDFSISVEDPKDKKLVKIDFSLGEEKKVSKPGAMS